MAPEIQRSLDPKHELEIDIETKNIASRKINLCNRVETQFLNITDLLIRTTVNWFNNASLVVTNISLMLINKKIVIFQLKQKAKEINMSTRKKNSLNGQKCQFLHKKQKNKIPNQWHMTIIMHVVQIKTYFYLHLLETNKSPQQQRKKKAHSV